MKLLSRESLLVDIVDQCFENLAVRCEPIGPGIVSEYILLFSQRLAKPCHRNLVWRKVINSAIGELLGLLKRFEQTRCNPRAFPLKLFSHNHRVHNREDSRSLEISPLHCLMVFEKTANIGMSLYK